ncbi:hypothetical protein MTR67_018723 [Solanum verrucosum]|uniref:Uncharacterized protein n=1 Tax=Solanum verrucosum TaxID=315347 RepID=A0AAF0QN29_SOLVR|nr:hypothetical protein MTR67_018723 [Solanum verrucosum]
MPNYGRERLTSRFSITIHRTQYLELKNSIILLISKMLDSEGSCGIMGMESSTQGLYHTTHFRNAQLIGFIRNYVSMNNSKILKLWSSCEIYGHERLDSRVCITIWNPCIRLFSFSYLFPQNITQIYS